VGLAVTVAVTVAVAVAVTVTAGGFGTVHTTVIRCPVPVSLTTGLAVQAAFVVAAWTANGTPHDGEQHGGRAMRACLNFTGFS
jgi:hypothetical protein